MEARQPMSPTVPPASTGAAELQPCIPLQAHSREPKALSHEAWLAQTAPVTICTLVAGKSSPCFWFMPNHIPLGVSSAQQRQNLGITDCSSMCMLKDTGHPGQAGRALPRAALCQIRVFPALLAVLGRGTLSSVCHFNTEAPSSTQGFSTVERRLTGQLSLPTTSEPPLSTLQEAGGWSHSYQQLPSKQAWPEPQCSNHSWSTVLSPWELGTVYPAGTQALPEKTRGQRSSPHCILAHIPSSAPCPLAALTPISTHCSSSHRTP